MKIRLLEFFQYLLFARRNQTSVRLLPFCYLFALGFTLPATAQITISNSVFPVVGDTLHYAIGNQPGAINQIFTAPGLGQQWDLSGLQPTQYWNQIMKNPQTGMAQASFPGASILYNPPNSGNEVYLQVTGNQVFDMGYFGLDELGLGLNLLFDNIPNLEETWAPIDFFLFDVHVSSSNVLTAFDAPIAPPVLLNLVPTADSFRIRVTYQRISSIDASGTLAIPGGTFDVLRKKRTEYKSMAVDVKVAPLGWIDISTIGGQQLLPLGTDTITTFHFLNDVSKEAIAICTLNTGQNQVTGVQYKAIVSANAGPDQTLCLATPAQLNATYSVGTPSWSVVSGPSTASSQFSSTSNPQAIFTPAGGPGAYTLRFTVTAGINVASDDVVITYNGPVVSICPPNLTVCFDQQAFTLTGGTPAGGTFSGPGVSTNMFNPGTAGIGAHTITYTAPGSCVTNCTFTITVNACQPGGVAISGKIIWETNDSSGVKDVNVALTGDGTDNDLSLANGTYTLTASSGSNFTVTPTKSINKFNGVTAADVAAIQQHVANISPISNLYKQVAADVNKSNSITSVDASIVNQALLGNPLAINQFKTSWRFVPVAHTMNIPPWGFPEKIVLTGVSGNVPDQDFFGIKTGDIVASFANPANFGAGKPLVFNAHDQVLQTGSEVLTEFRAGQLEDLAAFQFALRFDPAQLQLAAVHTDGSALPLTMDNFGLYQVSEGEIRAVWSQPEGLDVEEASSVFSLTFNVLQGGAKLSEALYLDESVLPGHAYNSALAESGVALNFLQSTETDAPTETSELQLFQNRPNPFNGTTTIGFVLPEACEAQLRIYDMAGRLITERRAQYPAGGHAERFDLENATGVLYYELVTPFGILAKKMTVIGE